MAGCMNLMRTTILILALLTTGLMAGIYVDWANTIMPGLSGLDDRTFVLSQQALNRAITNPLFLGVEFTGALLLTGLGGLLHLRSEQRRALIWIAVALVCYLIGVVITFVVHEPLNQKLMATVELTSAAHFAAVRAQFDGATWAAWHVVRTLATTVAFGCLTGAIVSRARGGATS